MGPLLVLYLTLEVLGSSEVLDPVAVVVCAFAVGFAVLPWWVLRARRELTGARRVAMLGIGCGVALVRVADPVAPSLTLDLAAVLAFPFVGALTVHLAFDAPDSPPAIARRRRWILGIVGLGVLSALSAGVAVVPLEWTGGVIVPARWILIAPAYLVFAWGVALILRLSRRRVGSTPEALAAGGSAHLATWTALAAAVTALSLAWTGTLPSTSIGVRGLAVAAGAALLAGHVVMLGVRRQVHAGRNTRVVIAATLTLVLVGVGAGFVVDELALEPIPFGVTVAFVLLLGAFLHRALEGAVNRLLAPYGGRLVAGCEEALAKAVGATTLAALGEAVLPALRRAADTTDAEPLLFTIDPPRSVRVDAAAAAHVDERELPSALHDVLEARTGEIVVAAPLAEQVVRRADLRPLVSALESVDALCVVPLSMDFELEGALVVPRGRRRGALTLEEIDALERLGRHIGGQVAMLGQQERARLRTRDAVVEREQLSEELEAANEELSRLRADSRTLKAGGIAERNVEPAIAYSAAMRAVMRKVDALAPVEAPVLVVGEEGSALDRVARRIHAASGRRHGAFVVAECPSVRPERSDAALFGEADEEHPGWLRLAEGGTLLLADIPALSLSAQASLAESLATRRAVLADGTGSYAVDARVIATSRVPLGSLVAAGAFDPELARRLEPLLLEVPPLRERREDLPSLVLLALDRVCRVTGRPVLGIDREALDVLEAHDWPGNLRELSSVIERAVASAGDKNIAIGDLPPLAAAVAPPDPWTGTYAEIEARVLVRALERAEGNKSEAARSLGLKRTTFLDKLKRHGLHGASTDDEAEPPTVVA
ncbi:MAG: sigma-54-dependent Fis family transcriptional regulator [Sandaracinaceae bacterium]|nr:sigma-54-dependent Fis family transcriptional regulator [Sandaracinaceae bacterium]